MEGSYTVKVVAEISNNLLSKPICEALVCLNLLIFFSLFLPLCIPDIRTLAVVQLLLSHQLIHHSVCAPQVPLNQD